MSWDYHPRIGDWFIYRPNRGKSARVRCNGYRGKVPGKKGWIETIDESGFVRSVAPACAFPDASQ